jgi:hypothetical protein
MKKVLPVLIPFLLLIVWNTYFPASLIDGKYISNNLNQPILEGPNSIDTLFLLKNKTFRNGAWESGTYRIKRNRIDFLYNYSFNQTVHKGIFSTIIRRKYFIGKLQIMLNSDLGYYYESSD